MCDTADSDGFYSIKGWAKWQVIVEDIDYETQKRTTQTLYFDQVKINHSAGIVSFRNAGIFMAGKVYTFSLARIKVE